MRIEKRIESCQDLTPVEHRIGQMVLSLKDAVDSYTIEEFARAANTSVASVHRFCKKIGVTGFKELKIELARSAAEGHPAYGQVDVNFPFDATDTPRSAAQRLKALYELTVADTFDNIDPAALARAARILREARTIDIYTHTHNFYAAEWFCDRVLGIGKDVRAPATGYAQREVALASGPERAAVVISYSGRAVFIPGILSLLRERGTPVIMVGAPEVERLHPGLACYLFFSDREHPRARIAQFSSHIALEYLLDVLYSSLFILDYDRNMKYLAATRSMIDNRDFSPARR